ncbi:PH domain-containing protein [Candidatus Micrarchaeota archaeon]|nr:PH domain-containing protein [Candidatus Micrarchaeota archaeon]
MENSTIEIHHLGSRVKIIWYLRAVFFALPVFFVILLVAFFGKIDLVMLLALLFLCLAIPYIPVELEYRHFTYAFREKDLMIKKGFLERKDFMVPYEKIQNVTVERSLIDRFLGTGTLHIETAGSAATESDVVLPGVYGFHDLINTLVMKSKKTQEIQEEKHDQSHDAMIELLGKIHEDLKTIKGQEPIKPVMNEMLEHSKGREVRHAQEHDMMIETLKDIRAQLREIHKSLNEEKKAKKKK